MAKKSLPVEKLKASKKPIPVKIVNSEPMESKAHEKNEKKWQAEDDLRALQRAKEIQKDKSRVAAAKAVAKEQMAILSKVCQ